MWLRPELPRREWLQALLLGSVLILRTYIAGPGGTVSGSVNNPLAIFAGALSSAGLMLPSYTFNFAPGAVGVNDGAGAPIAWK